MNVQKVIFYGSKALQPGQKINPSGMREMNGAHATLLSNRKTFHVTSQVKYPEAKNLPLPNNIEAIMSVEIGQFSPQRARDISGPVIYSRDHDTFQTGNAHPVFSRTFNQFLESYDCKGAVSLNSSMQSNVPNPFQWKGNCMYLNMPGGQWEQGSKFISEDMQKTHYSQYKKPKSSGIAHYKMYHTLSNHNLSYSSSIILKRAYSNSSPIETNKPLTRKEKLKKAVAEYGSTVIVFHVGISLMSLGACYSLVKSGLDMETFLSYMPWINESSINVAKNTGTFVTAYAIHKIMAPIRISITLASVPFIVRYLRQIGFLKKS